MCKLMMRTIGHCAAGALFIVSLCVAGCSESNNAPSSSRDRFSGRDGKQEALAAIQAGMPAQLYSHVFNGFAPGFGTPGIVNCSPQVSTALIFVSIPELDFAEGEPPSSPPETETSAYNFAYAYNREVYRSRTAELKKACPQVRIARESSSQLPS